MNMQKNEIQLTEQINQLIEQNQDNIILYLEEQLVKFKKIFSSETLEPWFLCFALNIEIIRKQDFTDNTKTILKFEETTPYIYYSDKLNNLELNFYLMKEFIYYLIILHLPSEFRFNKLFGQKVILHSITNDEPKMQSENIIEKMVYDYAIKFIMPEEIFTSYYTETKSIKKCSEYFGIEEKIIESYLVNNIKTLKKGK